MSRIKLLAVTSVLMLVTVACGLTNSFKSGAQQMATLASEAEALATSAVGAVPQAVLDDPQTYLLDTLRNQMLKEPFRATMESVSPDLTVNYTVEYQPPDRFHMNMPGTLEGIVIGKTMYLNLNGSWTEVPLTEDFMSGFGLLGPGGEDIFNAISDVKFVGADLLDGRPTLIFTYSANMTVAGIASTSTNKLWLGATDGRVYQIITEGEAAGVKSTTTARYEYDPTITVVAPY